MDIPRIGQILKNMGVISEGDVTQILTQQRRTGQKFGQIALAWGLARPEQIWKAWCLQLVLREQKVDLDEVGIDTRAANKLDGDYALRNRVLPLRLWGGHIVVALSDDAGAENIGELAEMTGCQVYYCFAEPRQLGEHLERLYACVCA